MMKYKHLVIASLLVVLNITYADNSGSYSGSQAFNKSPLFKESVNAATGTFDFSYPLITAKGRTSSFQINISYRFNTVGMFGLPSGWRLDLDYIDGKTAHLQGQQWLIDPLWHDETGFASGLKYYNLHGTKFIDEGVAKEIPEHKKLFYRYKASHKDGSMKYFSHQGLLVLEKDRFNNTLLFEYQTPVKTLTSAKLTKVTDNYGNSYNFSYAPNEIILNYPDHRHTHIYTNDQGVIRITNPLHQRTTFVYIEQDNQNLLRNIETPAGLITKLSYGAINYKNGSTTKNMPVVSLFSKYDKATNKTLQETDYAYSTDNNFTGYPVYGLSNSGDNLMDSNNQGYRYSVAVSHSDLQSPRPQQHTKVFYYNYLHLPVEVQTLDHGKKHLKTTYEYAISPFKYSRSTNYDKPSTITNYIWNEGHSLYLPRDKSTSSYDNYGNKIEEHHFIFDRLHWKWTPISSTEKTFFTKNYSLENKSTRTDELSGKSIRTQYNLSKDGKTQAKKITDYREKKSDETWLPWQTSNITHNALGQVTLSSKAWIAPNKPGIQNTEVKTTYKYNTANAQLETIKMSALGSETTEVVDTRNGNKISTILPTGDVWIYEYDDMNRLTKTTNPLGQVALTQHKDYQTSEINSITQQSPMQHKKQTEYDALGQVMSHQDLYNGNWRTLESYEYNGWGLVTKKTNIFGLSFITEYDEQKRPLLSIDPWNNIKAIDYNDLQLTTTTYLNKHKTTETVSVPWLATTHNKKFPVFDNPHDPQQNYLEETVVKNGFGQKEKHHSSLVHRYTLEKSETIKTHFQYDASNNLKEKTTLGFDGIQYHRVTTHDLFNNKAGYSKTVGVDNEITEHQGDTFTYNEDNLLVSIASPPLLCGTTHITRHQYDKNGRRVKTILPDNQTVEFKHDALGQLTQSTWQRNKEQYNVSRKYDADSRLIQLADNNNQAIHYSYTPNGYLTQLTYPDKRTVDYTYDDKDRVITQIDFNHLKQTYVYKPDDLGKLSEIHFGNNIITHQHGTDDNGHHGRLTQQSLKLEKEGTTESHYSYGPFNTVTKVNTINNQAGAIYNIDYRFKPRGQLITQSIHSHRGHAPTENNTTNYQYDSLNRLVNEHVNANAQQRDIHYAYDANNNILQEDFTGHDGKHTLNYTYNALDQLISSHDDTADNNKEETASPIATYEYNANGHLTQDANGTAYLYDDQGFLLSVSPKNGQAINYHYLPNGLLSNRKTSKTDQHFYYSKNKKVLTQKTNDQWLSMIRTNHSIIAGITTTGVEQIYKAHQSSGAILSNNGKFTTTTYAPYGKRNGDKPATDTADYGWNQEYLDPVSDLVYLQSRFYSPSLKRFISKDTYPIDNRYAFGNANPIAYIDPTGHNSQQALSYGLGSGMTALGIFGAIMAIPTGGASLTLSAGAGIASGVTAALSGISLMGSQGALDSGNKQVAKALQYTSIGLGVLALVEAGVAIAPKIGAAFFTTPSSASSFADMSGGPSVSSPVDIPPAERLITSSAESSPIEITRTENIYEPVDSSPSISPDSRASYSPSQVSDTIAYEPRSYINPESSGSSAGSLTPNIYDNPNSAIYARPTTVRVNGTVMTIQPKFAQAPLIPGSFSSTESIYTDMSAAASATNQDFYEDMSGLQFAEGLERTPFSESPPYQ